jgi:hypothetical protein
MKLIGHSSVVAQRGYAHVDQEQLVAGTANLNELLP